MRKPFVAGNWKMHKTVAEARQLVSEMIPGLQAVDTVDKVLCPPFTALVPVAALLEGTDIGLGAQNMHWEPSGAYTGEISPVMLEEFCQYVIVGHSERRAYFGETDNIVNRKIKSAFIHGLKPILCVGETLEENEANRTADVVSTELIEGLKGLEEYLLADGADILVIAYEPIWAIGTGLAATPEDASEVISEVIRPTLAEMLGNDFSDRIRILYGGSVKPSNAESFFKESDIDGALVGGASLKSGEFVEIARIAARV